ncbi:hypothetical protein [uncultured Fibrobacter sp.]|uniref:hypothetical protein n=1 Tax=uncultured Fibrobacter sp. TaxID=261512 RepID=UPI00260A0D36|nr:hypothetical protein [uncultured Fibrobacter sp.]
MPIDHAAVVSLIKLSCIATFEVVMLIYIHRTFKKSFDDDDFPSIKPKKTSK